MTETENQSTTNRHTITLVFNQLCLLSKDAFREDISGLRPILVLQ
ncbi:hypothetical protein [Pleurocapsa sp. CCALA 161]|nr:hypothetical protein [Pleurocapsa sp. CCALA 161]